MSYLSAIILGIVQGVSEFLPISSSGHLSILQNFFSFSDVEHDHVFFDLLLHFGTLVAVFVAYRQDIADLITEFFTMVTRRPSPKSRAESIASRRTILLLVVATLPLFLVLPIKDKVEGLYSNTIFIGCALIVTGLILFVSDRMRHGSKNARSATLMDAVVVGFGQAIATVPGISRSGTSISAGLLCGFERSFAVKFSFLMSIPAILGANILSISDAVAAGIDVAMLPKYLVGVFAAMISGYLCLSFLKRITQKGFAGFSYYCWGAGIVTLILSLIK